MYDLRFSLFISCSLYSHNTEESILLIQQSIPFMAPLTSRQCYDLLPSQYYEKNPVVDLKAWFKWANQKLCWCPVWERCIGAFVSLFLSWNHPLYLNWEEYVTVTAVCNHFCLHSASTFNTGITCDITFLLQSASKTPRQALPKFTERMGAFFGRIGKPCAAWENYTITTSAQKKLATQVHPTFWASSLEGF